MAAAPGWRWRSWRASGTREKASKTPARYFAAEEGPDDGHVHLSRHGGQSAPRPAVAAWWERSAEPDGTAVATNARDRTRRQPPPRAGQGESRQVDSTETEPPHGFDGGPDDVGEPPNRRHGLHGRSHGMRARIGVSLPVRDGVRADAEDLGRLTLIPSEQVLDLEDAEALRWCVVGPPTLRDLVHARGQEIDDLPGEVGPQIGFAKAGQSGDQRVTLGPELAEVNAQGESQEVSGVERGPQGSLEDRLLNEATQAQADRRRNQVVFHERDSGRVADCPTLRFADLWRLVDTTVYAAPPWRGPIWPRCSSARIP